jgi:hypothetical protein
VFYLRAINHQPKAKLKGAAQQQELEKKGRQWSSSHSADGFGA